MQTPFDDIIQAIVKRGYHNHRLEEHSDIVSEGIYKDLLVSCPYLQSDVNAGIVRHWTNIPAPGARQRKIDLFIGEPDAAGNPDITKVRICVENKSVITAHRNRDARFDDLNETMNVVHRVRPDAVIAATVMIGICSQVLNVPDKITPMFKNGRMQIFRQQVLPRLSTGDQSLWTQFDYAISNNRAADPGQTLAKLHTLPTRNPGHTHIAGYDFIVFAPMFINNVDAPYVARNNALGIHLDADYASLIQTICRAYKFRWHPQAP